LGHFYVGPQNILLPLLDLASLEEQSLGAPTKKTLLWIAYKLVRWAPNPYSSLSNPSYSDEEKTAAKALLKKYGYEKFANLSPRYKKQTLQAIRAALAGEA
jgi:hypothetical protein